MEDKPNQAIQDILDATKSKDLKEVERRVKEITEIRYIAMIFDKEKSAIQNLTHDHNCIKLAKGFVKYHDKYHALQLGLKPIKMLWYMHKGNAIKNLNGLKWDKIFYMDFEPSDILKIFGRDRLAFKGHTIFSAKDRIKSGLI